MKNLLAFFLLIVLTGCSSDSPETLPEAHVPKDLFIKEIKLNGVLFRTYEYDDENRLSSYTYHDPAGAPNFVYTYEYNGNTITETGYAEGEEYSKSELFSEGSGIIRRNISFDGILARYILYRFTEETCGHISEEMYNASGELLTTLMIEYLDDNCSRNEFSDDARVDATIIQDDKNNFGKMAAILPFQSGGGNIIEYIALNREGNVIEEWSYDSVIEYNEHDYPIVATRTFGSGKIEKYEYVYGE